jgi:tRNA1(Val) A37 N6-methylase TrmN6
MRAFGLEPKRLRWAHSRMKSPAELVYVQGTKDGKPGVEVMPPLYVHEPDGRFTDEMERMMGEGQY